MSDYLGVPTTELPAGEQLDALVDLYLFERKTLAHPANILWRWSLGSDMPCERCGRIRTDMCTLNYSSQIKYAGLLLETIGLRLGGVELAVWRQVSTGIWWASVDDDNAMVHATTSGPNLAVALCHQALALFGPRLVEFEEVKDEWLRKK